MAQSHPKPTPNANLNLENPDQFTVVTEFDYAEYVCNPGKFFGNMESVFRLQYTGSGYDASLLPRWVIEGPSDLSNELADFKFPNSDLAFQIH